MVLHIIRIIFVLAVVGISASYALRLSSTPAHVTSREVSLEVTLAIIIPAIIAVGLILFDMLFRNKSLASISGLFFGIVAGVFLAYIFGIVVDLIVSVFFPDKTATANMIKLLIGACTIYLCVSFVLQTKDNFRFIIPYVEFSKQTKGAHPLILDTSVIIDGRIADIAETQILEGPLIIPRFVLKETQEIADSPNRLKRARGRRGLDVLNRLRANDKIEIRLIDANIPMVDNLTEVDQKLVALAKHMDGKIVTNDYNLNKVARLRGVDVININDLANALKPVVLPGETLTVKIIKPGEEAGQGVGYLDDGTMVVVEQARDHIGETLNIVVTSTLQTSAGRMVFGKVQDANEPSI